MTSSNTMVSSKLRVNPSAVSRTLLSRFARLAAGAFSRTEIASSPCIPRTTTITPTVWVHTIITHRQSRRQRRLTRTRTLRGTEDTKTLQATTATEVADVVEATAVPATLQDDKVVEMSEGDFVGGSQIPQPALHREVRTCPRTWMPSGPVRIFGAHTPYPLPCSSIGSDPPSLGCHRSHHSRVPAAKTQTGPEILQ